MKRAAALILAVLLMIQSVPVSADVYSDWVQVFPPSSDTSVTPASSSQADYVFPAATVYLKDIISALGLTVSNNSALSVDNSAVTLSATTAKNNNLSKITLTASGYFDLATLTIKKNKSVQTVTLSFPDPSQSGPVETEEPEEGSDDAQANLVEGALYANEHLYLTGKIPGNGIIDVKPVTLSINGEEVLAAYDIKIYTNANQQKKGKTWQPADKKVQVHFFDESFEGKLNVYHVAETGTVPEYVSTVEAKDGWVEFEAGSFSAYAITRTLITEVSIGGATYRVTVNCDEAAGIPEGAALVVREVDPANYLDAAAETLGWSGEDQVYYTKFLDISIVCNGREIEPKSPVSVTVELLDISEGAEALEVVHFADDGNSSKVEAVADEDGVVTFSADSFSVFGFSSVLRSLLSWSENAVSYTLQGFSTLLKPAYESVDLSLEEGLEAVSAYQVKSTLGSLLNMLYVKVSTALNLGRRESLAVYSLKNGAVEELLTETTTNFNASSIALGAADGFAVVRDTGFRRLSFDLGAVELSGLMPKEAEPVILDVAEELEDLAEKGSVLAAFDITIDENGDEYQPDAAHPVEVSIAIGEEADPNTLRVWHIKDDGEREEVTDFELTEGKVVFTATGFSIYAITDESGAAETPRARYTFRDQSGNSLSSPLATQIIKNTEKLAEINAPAAAEGEAFVGWFIRNSDGTYGEQIAFDTPIQVVFGTEAAIYGNSVVVPETASNYMLEVDVRPVYTKNFATLYYMQDVDSDDTSKSENVHNSVKVPMPNGESSTEYTLPNITDNTFAVTPRNNTFTLVGWSKDKTGNYYSGSDNRTLVTSPLTVNNGDKILLYPVFKQAWIVSYATAPIGSGADYIPPAFVQKSESTAQSAKPTTDPSWRGYRFKYWTTTPTFDEDGKLLYDFTAVEEAPAEFNFNQQLTENITLYAYWESGYTTYTVIYWKQKVTDDKNWNLSTEYADQRTYEFDSQETREAKVGETVTLTEADISKEYTGFHHRIDVNKDTDSAVVVSSGSTLLNVYYDRNVITMKFYNGNGAPKGGYDSDVYTTEPEGYVTTTDNDGIQYAKVGNEYVQLTRTEEETITYRWQYIYNNNWYMDTRVHPETQCFFTNDKGNSNDAFIHRNEAKATDYSLKNPPPDDGTTYYCRDSVWTDYCFKLQRIANKTTSTIWLLNGEVYNETRYKVDEASFWYTGLYGQSLSDNGYSWPSGSWQYYDDNESDGLTTGMSFLGSFVLPDGIKDSLGKEIRLYNLNQTGNVIIEFYQQNADGSYSATATDISTLSVASNIPNLTFTFSEKYDGYNVVQYRKFRYYSGTKYYQDKNWASCSDGESIYLKYNFGYLYNLEIRYARSTYNIHYYDSTDGQPLTVTMTNGLVTQSADDVMYGAETSDYYPASSYAPTAKMPGWVFNGRWYSDQGQTTQVFFSTLTTEDEVKLWYYIDTSGEKIYCDYIPSAAQQAMTLANDGREYHKDEYEVLTTMPMRNLALYAGFTHEWYWVKVDPNGGYLNGNDSTVLAESGFSTWFWEQYGASVSNIKTDRTFIRDDNGAYYYHYDEFNTSDPNGAQPATRRAYYTTDASLSTDGGLKYREVDGVTEGYDFAGWYKVHADGSLTPFLFESDLVTGNTTIRALWRQRGAFKVYYSNTKAVDKNGNIIDGLSVTTNGWKDDFTYAENSTVVTSTDTMTSSDPENYTFVGWYLNTCLMPGSTFVARTVLTEKDPTNPEATAYDTFILYPVFEKKGSSSETGDTTKLILDANGGSKVSSFSAPAGSAFNDAGTQLTWDDLAINWHISLPGVNDPVYQKEKAEFVGWAFSSTATTPALLPGQMIGVDNVDSTGYTGSNTNILYAVWRQKEVTVRIRKVDHDDNSKPLENAVFTLTSVLGNLTSKADGYLADATGQTTFSLNTASEKNSTVTYTLTETNAPANYQSDGNVTISINYDGVVTYTQGSGTEQEAIRIGEDFLIVVTNTRKTFPVKIVKVDENGTEKKGATFTMSGEIASGSLATDGDSKVFDGLLYCGEIYTLVETSSPEGYVGLDSAWTFTTGANQWDGVTATSWTNITFDQQTRVMTVKNFPKYTLTYKGLWNGNDFTGAQDHDFGNGVTYTTNSAVQPGNNMPTPIAPAGYVFKGWAYTQDGSIDQNAAWTKLYNLKPEDGRDKELWAVYEKLLPIQAKTYVNGDWQNSSYLVTDSEGTYSVNSGNTTFDTTYEHGQLHAAYALVNSAVSGLHAAETHIYGLAAIGNTIIQAIRYVAESAKWQYTTDRSTWADVGDGTITLYYFPNPLQVPIYYMLENEDGTLTRITDRTAYYPLGDAVDEALVYVTYSYEVSLTGGSTHLPTATSISESVSGEQYERLYFGYGPGSTCATTKMPLTLGNDAFWLKNTPEGLKRATNADMNSGVVQNDLGIYIIYKKTSVTLNLTKTVSGGFGEKDRAFTFTFTVGGATSEDTFAYIKTKDVNTTGSGSLTSQSTFTLEDGESIAITLPSGMTITLIEEDGVSGRYTRTWVQNVGTVGTTIYSNDTLTITSLTTNASISLDNHLDPVAPTGISFNLTPFILLLAAGVLLLIVSRKRRERPEKGN